jgi:hypothetical protein
MRKKIYYDTVLNFAPGIAAGGFFTGEDRHSQLPDRSNNARTKSAQRENAVSRLLPVDCFDLVRRCTLRVQGEWQRSDKWRFRVQTVWLASLDSDPVTIRIAHELNHRPFSTESDVTGASTYSLQCRPSVLCRRRIRS